MPANYAFLLLEEHPYGREMLGALLAAGHVPALIIEERSQLADEERVKFETRMTGFELAPSIATLLEQDAATAELASPVARHFVPSHNDPRCEQILRTAQLPLLVLGGTRILRANIIEQAKHTLNSHPGLLPQVRGSASVAWAIDKDEPIGCTCHFIDAGIDTGDIVSRETIAVHRGDSYERLCWKTTRVSAQLMARALNDYVHGRISRTPQPRAGNTYRNMPDEGVAQVKAKLAAGEYAHFVD